MVLPEFLVLYHLCPVSVFTQLLHCCRAVSVASYLTCTVFSFLLVSFFILWADLKSICSRLSFCSVFYDMQCKWECKVVRWQ